MIGVVSYLIFFAILALTFGIAVMGLNLQWGFTGLFNAGVAGFLAVGGYTHAILTGPARDAVFGGFELPFVVGLLSEPVTWAEANFSRKEQIVYHGICRFHPDVVVPMGEAYFHQVFLLSLAVAVS